MKIVATYSIKGGVGKTSAAVNLGTLAARDGVRTLIWDLDPQGAASFLLRIKPKVKGGGKGLIRGKGDPLDVMKGTDVEGLDLLPADFSYRHLDIELDKRKKPLQRLGACSTSSTVTTTSRSWTARRRSRSSRRACSTPPTCCSCRSCPRRCRSARSSSCRTSSPRPVTPRRQVLGFLSMVDRRKKLHRELTESLPATLPAVSATAIPSASVVELMGVRRAPLVATRPSSPAAKAYVALWEQVRVALDGLPGLLGVMLSRGGPPPRCPRSHRRALRRDPVLQEEARVRLGELTAAQRRRSGGPRGGRAGRERVRAVAAVPVGRQDVGEAVADQLDRAGVRLGSLAAEQRAHVDLQQRAGGDLLLQHRVAVADEAVGPLRVRDHEAEAALADVPAGVEERGIDAGERHLEQHPAGAARAVGDDVELLRAQRGRALGVDLAAGVEVEVDAGGVERGLQRARAPGMVATSSGNHGWPTCGVTVASWTPSLASRPAWTRLAARSRGPSSTPGRRWRCRSTWCMSWSFPADRRCPLDCFQWSSPP